ncbi:meiosis-specific with OB domain-containing protein isoform X1 [Nematostella vectensis]|uniref:meiosis-specific with OB domain-containing protein isoform X1 n=1 Tax=Nematostella vectensis TaxID=45351 RepID=UPI0020776D0F|nr:meiosis-specific with OB domain-containing protein isoform X1 [Nematostella vectensis]
MSFNSFGTQSSWPDGSHLVNEEEKNPVSSDRTNIRELNQGIQSIVLVGLVIAKQEMHTFPDKKNPDSQRAHLHFTIRDSPTDFINVNCWGCSPYISDLSKSFKINDVVEVRNPQVQSKLNNEAEERWKPWTPSPFQLNLSENHSSVSLYSGWDVSDFDAISHIPIKASNDYYTLSDIIANGQNLHGEHINIQAIVRSVGVTKDITTKTGRHIRRCEVKLFDEMCPSFALVLWNDEFIELAQTWIPKDNILFIADAKVTFDDYKKAMIATCDQKTIVTTNPDTREAQQLYMYAQSADLADEEGSGDSLSVDLTRITDVLTVNQLKTRLLNWDDVTDKENAGILFAFFTELNIDTDDKYVVVTRCTQCNQRVDSLSGLCTRTECPAAANNMTSQVKTQYEIPVSLTDHTGTVQCRLPEKCAEAMLGYTAEEFLEVPQSQCTDIKFKYLLERCKVYFKIITSGKRRLRLLDCSVAEPEETSLFLQSA